MASCCSCFSKLFLYLINGLLLLIGLVPLVFGIIAVASKDILKTVIGYIPGTSNLNDAVDLNEIIKSSAIVLIILGAVLVVIGFVGFMGVCCKSPCLLGTYLALIIIIILAEIAIIVLAVEFPSTFSSGTKSVMRKSLEDNMLQDCNVTQTVPSPTVSCPQNNIFSIAWHAFQFELNCCGANNYTDYGTLRWLPRSNVSLAPLTCCIHPPKTQFTPGSFNGTALNQNCIVEGSTSSLYTQEGCFDVLLKAIVTSAVVIGVLAGIGALEIMLFIATIAQLAQSSKGDKNKNKMS